MLSMTQVARPREKARPAPHCGICVSAVELADPDELPPRLCVDLGLAEAAAGEPVSLDRFERALDRLSDATERADALYSLGQALYRFGRHDEAAAAFHRGAELFDAADQQVRLRFVGAAWAAESHRAPTQGGPEGVFDGDGPGTRAVLAVQALQQSLTTPPAGRAAALAIRALADGALLAEQSSQGPGVNLAVLALLQCGRVIEAQEAADAIVCDARGRGAQLAYAEASLIRALVFYARGRVNEAAADAQAALDGLGQSDNPHAQTALATLVNCMIERGELTEAESLLRDAQSPLAPTPAIDAYVLLARGRLHLHRKDIDAAHAGSRRCREHRARLRRREPDHVAVAIAGRRHCAPRRGSGTKPNPDRGGDSSCSTIRGPNPFRCCATSPGIDRDRRAGARDTAGGHHRAAGHRGLT